MVGYFNSITRNYYYWLLYELLYKYYRIYFLLDKFICSLGIIIKIDIRYINPIFNASRDVENFNINTDTEVDFNQRIKLYRLILI